jgi:DNA-binding transcriptional regulator YdaS (Cro superfamily)
MGEMGSNTLLTPGPGQSMVAAMDLQTIINDMDQRRALAKRVGTSPEYLWQIATGWNDRKAGPAMAQKIDAATGGKISKSELRPDLWPAEGKRRSRKAA